MGWTWRGWINNYINLSPSRLITIVRHAEQSNKLVYLKGLIATEMSEARPQKSI